MAFANPLLLIGLTAISVPVIIHLFNFRRYKTVYFSNVKLLDDIRKKTRRESQIQQLVVLLLRILGIAALVFAFAQPYIPARKNQNGNGSLVSIFIDNSASMETGSKDGKLLYDAVDVAKDIVGAFGYSDDFVLTTEDFSGEESHILNKDEMTELLDKIQTSPHSRSFSDILAFESNTCDNSHKGSFVHYYISDFQKNNFDMARLSADSNAQNFLIPMSAQKGNNVAVDTCWFSSPVFKAGSPVTLVARIHNYGETDIAKLPVKLYVNGRQKAIAAIDLKAGTCTDCRMDYNIDSAGTQAARIVIEDAPIVFDDQLFFTYDVTGDARVIAIQGKTPNRFLNALYGKDSVFSYRSMVYNEVNYSELREAQVLVMSEVPAVSTGLADEVLKFVQGGGTLLVLPCADMEPAGWNAFLAKLGAGTYGELRTAQLKCSKINTESVYFKEALEGGDEHLDMPGILQYHLIQGGSQSGGEPLMTLENGAPLLNAYSCGKGKVILSAVGMDDSYGNAHRHTLFFVPLHNIGIMNVIQDRLYKTIGKDQMQTVPHRNDNSDELFTLTSERTKSEFIPEQRSTGNETALYFHDQIQESGFYTLAKGGVACGTLAFNADRKESDLAHYTFDDLKKMSKATTENTGVMRPDTKNMTKDVTDRLNGRPLWFYFVILSLACFLVEVTLLRYWGKPKLNKAGHEAES